MGVIRLLQVLFRFLTVNVLKLGCLLDDYEEGMAPFLEGSGRIELKTRNDIGEEVYGA